MADGRRGQGPDGRHGGRRGAAGAVPPLRHHQGEAADAATRPAAPLRRRHRRCQEDAGRRGPPRPVQGHGRAAHHRRSIQRRPLHRQGADGGRAALRAGSASHRRPAGRRGGRRWGRRLVRRVPHRGHQMQVASPERLSGFSSSQRRNLHGGEVRRPDRRGEARAPGRRRARPVQGPGPDAGARGPRQRHNVRRVRDDQARDGRRAGGHLAARPRLADRGGLPLRRLLLRLRVPDRCREERDPGGRLQEPQVLGRHRRGEEDRRCRRRQGPVQGVRTRHGAQHPGERRVFLGVRGDEVGAGVMASRAACLPLAACLRLIQFTSSSFFSFSFLMILLIVNLVRHCPRMAAVSAQISIAVES